MKTQFSEVICLGVIISANHSNQSKIIISTAWFSLLLVVAAESTLSCRKPISKWPQKLIFRKILKFDFFANAWNWGWFKLDGLVSGEVTFGSNQTFSNQIMVICPIPLPFHPSLQKMTIKGILTSEISWFNEILQFYFAIQWLLLSNTIILNQIDFQLCKYVKFYYGFT